MAFTKKIGGVPFDPNEERLLSINETCDLLGCQKQLLYDLMNDGTLRYTIISKSRKLRLKDLREYIDRNTVQAGAKPEVEALV